MRSIKAAGVIPYRRTINHGLTIVEYLLVQHRHDHWEFPKGKLDEGETIQQAALRELAEETGLTAQLHDDFHETIEYTFFDQWLHEQVHKQVDFFLGYIGEQQKVTLSAEHSAFVWLSHEQAYDYLTHKESKLLLEKSRIFLLNIKKSK
jgi:mutator protein MutT